MASFENESTAMKFSLTVDDSKCSTSINKISSDATAEKLDSVADAMKVLLVSTPTKVSRSMVDEIVK